MHQVGTSSLIK